MALSGKMGVLVAMSWRNLWVHKVSTAIVGSIIFLGTFLVVVGTSLLDTIDHSMAQSVTQSIAGQLQIHSAEARDPLALFGSGFMATDDIGELSDFRPIKKAIEALPNVKAVVPMGFQFSTVAAGNEIDLALNALREAVKTHDAAAIAALSGQIRGISRNLTQDMQRRLQISTEKSKIAANLTDLQRVQAQSFWDDFGRDSETGLLYLDTHIAPLAEEGQLIYLRNLGTDLHKFSSLFDRFEIVEGAAVPAGKRGFLFAKRVYERTIKNKVAREFDDLHSGITEKGKTIANDALLNEQAKRLPRQYQRITFQLSPDNAEALTQRLRAELPDVKGDLNALVQAFLTVDDGNFLHRFEFFYAQVAPLIRLYNVKIGDVLTLRAYTKAGYLKAINVKVYGTFQFRGLERSDLAGAENLVDLMTFRDLYGYMTAEKRAELESLRKEVGAGDVQRGDAEAALFGAGPAEVHDSAGDRFDEFSNVDLRAAADARDTPDSESFDEATIDDGLAINAAVILHDPTLTRQTQKAIEDVSRANNFNLKVVDWQAASGIVGQFIVVVRIVLYVAIFIIFLVALVIINNAMVMATMERVTEIGTLRAIGAQRRFILLSFLVETLTLGLSTGLLGALAGAATVKFFGVHGIPASTDTMVFLFSGPRLYPTVGAANLLLGVAVILAVSLISTLYPARIATRIQPVVAMQAKE